MERVLVLCARSYSFTDKETGRLVEGASISYLTGDVEEAPDRRGMEPLTVQGPTDVLASLGALPALCDMDFKSRPGPRGRPQLVLSNVSPVRAVSLEKVFIADGPKAA